jgi:hypothetical protein
MCVSVFLSSPQVQVRADLVSLCQYVANKSCTTTGTASAAVADEVCGSLLDEDRAAAAVAATAAASERERVVPNLLAEHSAASAEVDTLAAAVTTLVRSITVGADRADAVAQLLAKEAPGSPRHESINATLALLVASNQLDKAAFEEQAVKLREAEEARHVVTTKLIAVGETVSKKETKAVKVGGVRLSERTLSTRKSRVWLVSLVR